MLMVVEWCSSRSRMAEAITLSAKMAPPVAVALVGGQDDGALLVRLTYPLEQAGGGEGVQRQVAHLIGDQQLGLDQQTHPLLQLVLVLGALELGGEVLDGDEVDRRAGDDGLGAKRDRQMRLACIPLSVPIGVCYHRGGNQPVAVLHQRIAQIAQLRLLPLALLVQPRISISGRCMRLAGSLLVMEIGAVAVIGTVFRAKALLPSPRLNQRAIHHEVLVAHEPLRMLVHFSKELLRHIGGQQSVAVSGKHCMVPHRVIHARTHKPAEQKVVVDLLHQ